MIYVDAIQEWPSGKWCHLWTEGGAEELHQFAESIGLRREWAQHKPGYIVPVHYDLRPSKHALAIKMGAAEVSLLAWLKERRQENT